MYFSKFAVAGLLAVTGTIPVLASPVQGTIVARRSEMIKKDLPDGVEVHEVHDLDDVCLVLFWLTLFLEAKDCDSDRKCVGLGRAQAPARLV